MRLAPILLLTVLHITSKPLDEHGDGKGELPREERKERICRVHGASGVCRSCCVDLAASAESSEGIKHPRAQKADKTKHDDLGYGVVVNTPQTFGPFVQGDRIIVRSIRATTFLVGRTGHNAKDRVRGEDMWGRCNSYLYDVYW